MEEWEFRDRIDTAFAAMRDGDYVRALAIGDQLAAESPDCAAVRAIRAQALLGSETPGESYHEACRAVELAPDDAHIRRILAFAAWRVERLGMAQEAFERAVELSRRAPAILSEYAWFLAVERGPKVGEQAARDAIRADADSSTAWAALGRAQFRLHQFDEAETSLRRAMTLNPNDIYAQSAMLALLQERRQDERAEPLVDLLAAHAGTEEMLAVVRNEAKQRQIDRMLVERRVPIAEPPHAPSSAAWIWLLAGMTLVGLLFAIVSPAYLPLIVVFAVALLFLLHRLLS